MPDLLVNIDVADLESAVTFYTEGLGLRLARRLGRDIAELRGGPCPVYLIHHAADALPFADAPSPRDSTRHWTPVHLDFVVRDLERAIARAEAVGAAREGAIRAFDGGRFQVLVDPFGNGLCLLQFEGRGYAEMEGA